MPLYLFLYNPTLSVGFEYFFKFFKAFKYVFKKYFSFFNSFKKYRFRLNCENTKTFKENLL